MKLGDLRIYDKNFELLAILPRYLSVNWEIKFKEFGTGEIELEKTNEIVALLTENKYLFLFHGDIQSIVTGYKIGEKVTVFVRTLEWLLTKFTAGEFSLEELSLNLYSGTWSASRLIKYVLTTYLHKSFNVEFIEIENDESDMSGFVSDKVETIYSVIKRIIGDHKYGFKFYRDQENKRFVFLLMMAKENNDIILCDEYKTSYESEYSVDIQKEIKGGSFYHAVKNMGSWDAYTNTPQLHTTPDNYGKYYTVSKDGSSLGFTALKGDVILCTDKIGHFTVVEKAEPFLVEIPPEEDGIFSWNGVLDSQDTKSAEDEIKMGKKIDILTCKMNFSHIEDFEIGDIVKVKFFADNLSCEKNKLISEIHLWEEPDDSGMMPTTIEIS